MKLLCCRAALLAGLSLLSLGTLQAQPRDSAQMSGATITTATPSDERARPRQPSAAPTAPSSPEEPVDPRSALPIAAALVAGPVAHGVGHLVAGQTRTGLRLLAAEGVGLLGVAGGLVGLAVTGASEKLALPLSAVIGAGMGLFATSLLADIYGVAAAPGGFGRAVSRPALIAEAGAARVVDPVFDYDAITQLAARAFLGAHSVSLRAELALDHANQRLRGVYAYRLAETDTTTYLEAELGAVHHRFGPEGFSMSFAEAALGGRMGLHHIGPTLQGAFVEGAFGVAFGAHRYFDLQTESDSMMLIRLGFGFVVGDGGEWKLYYDHRHDGFAGGMKLPGLGSGVIGHAGTALAYYFGSAWGVSLRAETGSAHVIGASVLYRRKHW